MDEFFDINIHVEEQKKKKKGRNKIAHQLTPVFEIAV
jgi:hypothetical protein